MVSNKASNPLSVGAQDLQLVLLNSTIMLPLEIKTRVHLETKTIADLETTTTVVLGTSNPQDPKDNRTQMYSLMALLT